MQFSYLDRRVSILGMFLISLTWVHTSAAEHVAKGIVTDRDDRPIKGAQVIRLAWTQEDADAENEPLVLTNDAGEFEYPIKPKSDDGAANRSSFVVIFKEGYAVSALNLDVLPARARLHRMKPVAVKILDENDLPVFGAKVAVREYHFREEFLQAGVPEALNKSSVKSRADGWAILRCARPEFLQSVSVSADGYGTQTFSGGFDNRRFNVLRLAETHPMKVRVLEGEKPLQGISVMATSREFYQLIVNQMPNQVPEQPNSETRATLPESILFTGKTNELGEVVVDHALLNRDCYLVAIDSKFQWRGGVKAVAKPGANQFVIKATPLVEEIGSVRTGRLLEKGTDKPIANATVVYFTGKVGAPRVEATTNADGRYEATLNEGNWLVQVKDIKGYCEITPQRVVINDPEQTEVPDIQLLKGKPLTGVIQEIDLSIRRARWIRINWQAEDGGQGLANGVFDPQGKFTTWIPEDAQATSFQIVSTGGGQSELQIKSLKPLVLTSKDPPPQPDFAP